MATQLKNMSGEEFVNKILEDERDLSGIRLEEGFDLRHHTRFPELLMYSLGIQGTPVIILNSGDDYEDKIEFDVKGGKVGIDNRGRVYHKDSEGETAYVNSSLPRSIFAGSNYLSLDNSELRGLNARAVHLPHLHAQNSDLSGSNFSGSYLEYASFWNSNLTGVNFQKSNLKSVDFSRSDVSEADFREAVFWGGKFGFAHLRRANFKGAKNIDKGGDWEHAFYDSTIVGELEERIIYERVMKAIAGDHMNSLSEEKLREMGLTELDVSVVRDYEWAAVDIETGKIPLNPKSIFYDGKGNAEARRIYGERREELDELLREPRIKSIIDSYLKARDRFEYWLGESHEENPDLKETSPQVDKILLQHGIADPKQHARDLYQKHLEAHEDRRLHLEKLLAKTPEKLFDVQ